MKLLLVEDETKSANFVRNGLSECGYLVDVAHDGEAALELAMAGSYELIILDLLLPGRDGWSVLSALRRAGRATPVLILSAVADTGDRVRGLDSGADDYLAKPFSFLELVARVRSVLRRRPGRTSELLAIGDLTLDIGRHRATRAAQRLDLTPKEFKLLAYLMRRRGEVVTRRMICEHVWEMFFDPGTNVVDVHIRRLRAKVDDIASTRLIHTVRGMGYVLEERAAATTA